MQGEQKGQKMGEIEEQRGKKARRFHSEKHACPSGENLTAVAGMLSRRQTQRSRKAFWNTEEPDGHLARCGNSRVASEPLRPIETVMGALRPGQRRSRAIGTSRERRRHLHLQALISQEMHAGLTITPPAPVPPQERSRPDLEGMQEHTHLTRLRCHLAQPLALFAQRTRTATANAGSVHHTQAPIGFPTPLMR